MNAVNPLAHLSDDELVAEHTQQGANSFHLTEMLRRHKVESAILGRRIWWSNVLLLIVTVAICVLTGVLVWTSLREVGAVRRQSAPASSSAGSAWVLWRNEEAVKKVERDGSFIVTMRSDQWVPAAAYPSRSDCIDVQDRSRKDWPEKPKIGDQHFVYRCLPGAIDPRGPRGK